MASCGREVAAQRGRRRRHQALHGPAGEAALDDRVLRLGARGDDQEAADEREPQPPDGSARERDEPSTTSPMPNARPIRAASAVACSRPPMCRHSSARATAPAVEREGGQEVEHEDRGVDVELVVDEGPQPVRERAARRRGAAPRSRPARPPSPPGRASAKRSSSPGASGSPVIRATPPSSHRSISSTSSPWRRATTAWPSSCRRMPRNSVSALASPADTRHPSPSAGASVGK